RDRNVTGVQTCALPISEDFPTDHGFKALAAGCVLITGTSASYARDEMVFDPAGLVDKIPAINTSPDNLGRVIDQLLNDRTVVCRSEESRVGKRRREADA